MVDKNVIIGVNWGRMVFYLDIHYFYYNFTEEFQQIWAEKTRSVTTR